MLPFPYCFHITLKLEQWELKDIHIFVNRKFLGIFFFIIVFLSCYACLAEEEEEKREEAESGCEARLLPQVKGADRQKNYSMKNLSPNLPI